MDVTMHHTPTETERAKATAINIALRWVGTAFACSELEGDSLKSRSIARFDFTKDLPNGTKRETIPASKLGRLVTVQHLGMRRTAP